MTVEEKIKLVKIRIPNLDRILSEEQLSFILQPIDQPAYLKACPGSGKTEVVGIKAAYEIEDWAGQFSGIAILSFTNNAATEISDRVKKYGSHYTHQNPHFIGTIDSWLHGYILHPHGYSVCDYKGDEGDKSYRLVDNEEKYDFLNNYKTNLSPQPDYKDAWVNEYYLECAIPAILKTYNKSFSLAGLSESITKTLKENKKAFLKSGFTTYADAEFLCYYLLTKHAHILKTIVKRFPVLIIDECQDLSHNQLEILNLLCKAGVKIHFVGDNNQSIYEFKNVFIEKIDKFVSDNNLTTLNLTRNFRSAQKIVNIALHLEKLNTGITPSVIVGNQDELLEHNCILWQYSPGDFLGLPQKFIDYINEVNKLIPQGNAKIEIKKCSILSRGKNLLSEFKGERSTTLSKTELIANALQSWDNRIFSSKDMQIALQHLGKAICLLAYSGAGNHQNQYCPAPYNHIEWRQLLSFLITDAIDPINQLFPFDNLNWSDWSKSLKNFLSRHWIHLRNPSVNFDSAKAKIKAPNGDAKNFVLDAFKKYQNPYTENIRMTTFHDVKGETLDAVLVISSRDKKSTGGHVEHWISPAEDKKEYVRFAYVASSRPKHLLIWAIPKKNDSYVKRLCDMGFKSM